MRPEPGSSLEPSKYELLCLLATGGMASVHLARAKGIGGFEKLVVIKRILPQTAEDDAFIKMFLEEARVAATLHHANVVQVFDVGYMEREVFLAMEFLHGHDVRAITRAVGGPVPVEEAVRIVVGACAGLHYAHEKRAPSGAPLGLVHRDVSPSNLVVTYDGTVKVIDFGIAKVMTRSRETRSGMVKGKPGYMSPEQCTGMPLDRRSDLFCVGILLYELTTGTRLFGPKGAEYLQMKAVVDLDYSPPSAVILGFSSALERIILKALARMPEDRYQTAAELQRDLEAFARDSHFDLAPTGLLDFMNVTFHAELEAWRAAEHSGVSFAEYLVGRGDRKSHTLREHDSSESPTETATPADLPRAADMPHPTYTPREVDDILGHALDASKEKAPGAIGHETLVTVAEEVGLSRAAVDAAARVVMGPRRAPTGPGTGAVSNRLALGALAIVAAAVAVALVVGARVPASKPASSASVLIPSGTFLMGSSDGPDNERPAHRVSVGAFRMDRTEVTVHAYRECARAGVCSPAGSGPYCNAGVAGRDNHPINCVDWTQATNYCTWAGARLPTEEEWEYAARGEGSSTYPWGDTPPGAELCRTGKGSQSGTCPVGSFPASNSRFGVSDMAGNVWEWTASAYGKDYASPRSSTFRVDRGGDFSGTATTLRSATRSGTAPPTRLGWLGFRCARDA